MPNTNIIFTEHFSPDLKTFLISSARLYRDKLLGKQFLVIYGIKNQISSLEITFNEFCWRHLVGIIANPPLSDLQVFNRSLKGTLKAEDIIFPISEDFRLKAAVSDKLFHFYSLIKHVTNYNGRFNFYTEKLLSDPNTCLCLGAVLRDDNSRMYVCNTLQKRTRKEIEYISIEREHLLPIRAIFSKEPGDIFYTRLEFVRKDINSQQRNSILGIGIIPTRVGSTMLCIVPSLDTRDHPHACGEHE